MNGGKRKKAPAVKLFGGRERGKASPQEEQNTFGDRLSFAAAEAYKLLRTNLMFALPDEKSAGLSVLPVPAAEKEKVPPP